MGGCLSVCATTPSLTSNEAATIIQTAIRGKLAHIAEKNLKEQPIVPISQNSNHAINPTHNLSTKRCKNICDKFEQGVFPEKLYTEAFDLLEKELSDKETGNIVLSLFTGKAKFEASFLNHLQQSQRAIEHPVKIKKLICVDYAFHALSCSSDLFNNIEELKEHGLVEEIVLLPCFSKLSNYLKDKREKIDLAFSIHRNMPAFTRHSFEQIKYLNGDIKVEFQFSHANNQGEYAQAMSSPELSKTGLIHIVGHNLGDTPGRMDAERTTCYDDACEYFSKQQKSIEGLHQSLNRQDMRFRPL